MKRGPVWFSSHVIRNAAILAAFSVCAAEAQEVTLTSKGGALALSGRLIGFDGTYLTVESTYGPLTVPLANVVCDGAACPDPATYVPELRFSGSSVMSDLLMPALFDGFARRQGWQMRQETLGPAHVRYVFETDGASQAVFDLLGTTAAEGFADFIAFEADIVMADREPLDEEIARAADVGVARLEADRQARIVALDGMLAVVSPFLTVDRLTITDLAMIFSGEIESWARLGGPDQPIRLHLTGPADGLTRQFLDNVIGASGRSPAESIVWHERRQDMLAAIAEDHGAVGITSVRETGLTRRLSLTDRCGFVTTPRLLTLKTEDYPLTTPLFLYLPERRLPEVASAFLRFLREPEGQLIVRRANFVDPGAVPIPLDAQGQRFAKAIAAAGAEVSLKELQDMVGALLPRTRLSTSFRFEAGSVALDAQSGANLLMLAQEIRDGAYGGRSLLLAGFSDGRGAAPDNRALSRERAESIRDALVALVGDWPEDVAVEVAGFGEALPMGCDDTLWGRRTNRRVELWVSE